MNSRAGKMFQELQELLQISRSVCISLFMPVNLIFFGVFSFCGGWWGVGVGSGCDRHSIKPRIPQLSPAVSNGNRA